MHPFIHPLSRDVDPAWESRSDWEIFKDIARKFSEVCVGHLGVEQDIVAVPTLHDTPNELAEPLEVKDWKRGECKLSPGKTAPVLAAVERNYPDTYHKFSALGRLLAKLGNGAKGINWDTEEEAKALAELNYTVDDEGVSKGMPRIDSDIDACEVVLSLAPETNGHVSVKSRQALSKITGRGHTHLALPKEHEKIRFRDIVAQPRKIISSPTRSGFEDETVSYNAGYMNVHELIPWRTITGRRQFYQDHPWMRAFGEPVIWISEADAAQAGIEDNDWIEVFNVNGAIAARAVVSQRVPVGMSMMYHAQEKIVNTPGSEITGARGGIHNSVTRAILKPTHMIGGYAQQSYGFNYYGTAGANRDEFIIVRKLDKVDWLEESDQDAMPTETH